MLNRNISILSTSLLTRSLVSLATINNITIDEISFIHTKFVEDHSTSERIRNYLQRNITAIFTSRNAVDAILRHLKQPPQWKIYCIGSTTKKLVMDNFGKSSVSGTANNAADLANLITGDNISDAVFFCGDQRRDELPERLNQNNVSLQEIVLYTTHATPVRIDKEYEGVLFFSPSGVESFFSLNNITGRTKLFAIGSTTADAIQQFIKNDVIVAGSPGRDELVREMVKYYTGVNFRS